MRLFVSTVTTYTVAFSAYDEVIDEHGAAVLQAIPHVSSDTSLHRTSAHRPYTNRGPLQLRRVHAERLGTTFVYDLPDALRHALRTDDVADPVLQVIELDLQDGRVVHTSRPPAKNTMGMVAWRLLLRTPEYPAGRPLYLLANDVTFQAGSFGPKEDAFFAHVCRLACRDGVPLLYVSANSGARLGLAPDVMSLFRAKFVDDDPTRGFEYLYLADQDVALVEEGVVRCVRRALPDGRVPVSYTHLTLLTNREV